MACTIPWDPWLTERLASSGQCQLTLPKPMTPFKSTYTSVSSPRPSYFTSRFTDLSCKARPLSQSLLHEKRLRPLTDTGRVSCTCYTKLQARSLLLWATSWWVETNGDQKAS